METRNVPCRRVLDSNDEEIFGAQQSNESHLSGPSWPIMPRAFWLSVDKLRFCFTCTAAVTRDAKRATSLRTHENS